MNKIANALLFMLLLSFYSADVFFSDAKADSIVKTYCFYEAKICLDSPTEVKVIITTSKLAPFDLFNIEVEGKIFKMYNGSHANAPICTLCPNPKYVKSQHKTIWSFVKNNIVIFRELLITQPTNSIEIQIHVWVHLFFIRFIKNLQGKSLLTNKSSDKNFFGWNLFKNYIFGRNCGILSRLTLINFDV